MNDPISEYLKWKQQGENLRAQAKHAMESRFRELLTEAARIAQEYRADFGVPLKPPAQVTAFRYKTSSARPKPKKEAAAPKPAPAAPKAEAKPDPKVAALEKKLAGAKKKLEDAKAGGSPTRVLEDRVYELEDALKLAQ
jgi:hypothetical protein